jgi:hypothetical protein
LQKRFPRVSGPVAADPAREMNQNPVNTVIFFLYHMVAHKK